jgi:hypothetical protein
MSEKVEREKDKPEGNITEENLVDDQTPKDSEENSTSDISEVALAVRKGEWGKGQERRQRLNDAGYDVKEVEAEVTKQLNKK